VIDRRLLLGAMAVAAAAPAAARPPAWRVQRTGFGAPDLQGLWSNASYTFLERPKTLKTLALSPAEALAFEAERRKTHGVPPNPRDLVGQSDSEFPETGAGLARIHGEIRSSQIVDPPDGRLPYTQAALARLELDKSPPPERFDNPEDRSTEERCLTNPSAGAPILTSADTNVFQIVQAPDSVVILSEKYHDARIVRLGAAPGPIPSWLGESVGRWVGDSLFVETTGLRPGFTRRSNRMVLSQDARVVERFTREAADTLLYEFTVIDPALYSRIWRAEMVFAATRGPLFEDACHEGNYSLASILAAARQGNQAPDEPTKAP
jgi:hypothetical protein